MKILVFGAKGWIGSRLLEAWPDAVGTDARIDDPEAVRQALDEHRPDAVVNAAGKTGRPNVDWCEDHKLETTRGNVIGTLLLAEACQERNTYLLHIGSGCVFYGPSPDPRGWKESDHANPSAFYSRSKYATDLILSELPNTAVARLRMPIDGRPGPRNLIDKLTKYTKVIDVENSVTIIDDLVYALRGILEKRATGIFHTVNPGVMRHRDLINLYRQLVDPAHICEWITEEELVTQGLATKKRSNNILQSDRLREIGIHMRPISEALRDTMEQYAEHVKREALSVNRQAAPSFLKSSDVSRFTFHASRSREMKGVLLAGGKGTRLAPLTDLTNKHLLPIANRQMILYPLQTLLEAGIRDIMLITGPDHAGSFMNLLGSGAKFGCNITYRIQDTAGGIAQALGMAESFVEGSNCTAILGDNLFEDNFLGPISSFREGAMAFYKPVSDARRFGVMEIDQAGNVLSIEEKPSAPRSNNAQVGLYVYEPSVFDIIKTLKPSGRGELEITDVNNAYLRQGRLVAKPVRGFWSDAGTFQSLKRATEFFSSKEGLA